jgi:hypothetical protein
MYALLCERVYNCHLDNHTENMVTEVLSRNGRLFRFRYIPVLGARHISPSLRLFVPNSLTVYHRSFFSEGSARDIFLWLGIFCLSAVPTNTAAPSLSAIVPSATLIRSSLALSVVGGRCFYLTCYRSTRRSFFRFGGGRPLHKVKFLLFRDAA